MSNVNDTYFDGHYKDIWRSLIPTELTKRETDFLINYFQLNDRSSVLDIMCGYGRHSLELGRNSVTVSAFDNLPEYVDEVNAIASEEHLPVRGYVQNVLSIEAPNHSDLAICMGNSICFFNYVDTISIFKSIHNSLKNNGKFLLNTWSIAEITVKDFTPRSWSQVGELKFLVESKFALQPSRILSEHHILSPNGDIETKQAVDYIYSLNETEAMLNSAGFEMSEVYSVPGKRKFTLGDPRAYIVATKIA